MGNISQEFFEFREEINKKILQLDNDSIKSFFDLDSAVYKQGNLNKKTKEMLGLIASMVLKCDECIYYHLDQCKRAGVTYAEFLEIFSVALVVGGSIVIPHLRKAIKFLEEIEENKKFQKENKKNYKNERKRNTGTNNNDKHKNICDMYTDGACIKNPGPGAYAAILLKDGEETEITGFKEKTTNNRMELEAVIAGLKNISSNCFINIYSDSSYVIKGITDWINDWKENNWKTASGNFVKNKDLWQELDKLVKKRDLKFKKVKAHSGDEYNDKVDELARKTVEKHIGKC